MKKVEAQCRLWKTPDGDFRLNLLNANTVIGKLVEMHVKNFEKFEKKFFDIDIKPVAEYKSNKQLGYWKAEVVPKAAWGFELAGWEGMNEEKAEKILKEKFFTETLTNPKTGEHKTIIKTLQDVTHEDMGVLIETSVMFISEDLGVECEDPEDYKKRNLNVNFK